MATSESPNVASEKAEIKTIETVDPYTVLSAEDAELMRRFEGKAGKKVTSKVDRRLVPVMALLYLLSHIDRANVGNAKLEGMDKDLGLKGNQYNIISTLFFVPYIIFEIPSNIVLKKVRPSLWLSFLVVSWGTIMTCMGAVQNFQGLLACRVLLGLAEAGFFPGAAYVITTWYPRHELQQRLAIFYTTSAFSGAFSGLLAYAIAKLDGAHGVAGWRWIFLIEGAVTVGVGLLMPWLMVESAEKASWLTEDEKRFISLRLQLSGVRPNTEEGDRFSWKLLIKTMLDPKILLGILVSNGNSVSNAAFKFTMPEIVKQMGFTTSKAQLLTIPPYFCGGVSAWVTGWLSDKFTWRMPFLAVPLLILVTAISVLFGLAPDVQNNVPALYFAVVLAQIGIYPVQPGIGAWTGNNLAPSWKRSIGLAWLFAAGNLGAFVGTNTFLEKEAPRYQSGYGSCLGVACLALAATLVLEVMLWSRNKKKASMDTWDVHEQYTEQQLDEMGDTSPLFKYIL
ncbi:hypothetical protein M409DRAFT_37608 [Zasmidium cellare ATCC 36951]|uniref:Major facilitator superfamily (MFS) profile domain-containing protein n=1 Tax=Zasmidium cellare ATCC 36951 TaxID=1080233 RepID=A0A6A6C2C0_ZASCE|nr:uncharacterized protein M409DRAFT_37608 [Zasmidium cellare ATCC 36951]KAF2161135.1 hypothetical protein M409DRAFT_37608 [Zasmidium cellare ATCC 36951]